MASGGRDGVEIAANSSMIVFLLSRELPNKMSKLKLIRKGLNSIKDSFCRSRASKRVGVIIYRTGVVNGIFSRKNMARTTRTHSKNPAVNLVPILLRPKYTRKG